MNEMEKIAELYMDTAAELEKAAAEEGVDLSEVIADMDDEEVAALLDAAVEDRLEAEGYGDEEEVEASAFMFKTAELLEKAAGPRWDAFKGWAGAPLRALKESTAGKWVAETAAKHPRTAKWLKRGGVAGVGVGGTLAAQALARKYRKNKRG